jgi:hypothetical protein
VPGGDPGPLLTEPGHGKDEGAAEPELGGTFETVKQGTGDFTVLPWRPVHPSR